MRRNLVSSRLESTRLFKSAEIKKPSGLNALWAALEPDQRKALVASVRTKLAEREARFDKMKTVPPTDQAAKRLERMTKDLELDDAQKKKVEALLKKPEAPAPLDWRAESKKVNEAVLAAFESDSFDAKKIELTPGGVPNRTEGLDKHVQFLTQLTAILKPEQREKLAAAMEKPPMRHPGRPENFGPRFDPWADETPAEGKQ